MQIDKDTGVCIQIGLLNTAEMLYLTETDWQKQIEQQADTNKVPDFDYDKWVLYAVDCNPVSIAIMSDKYKQNDVRWLCAYLSDNNSIVPVNDETSQIMRTNLLTPSLTLKLLVDGLGLHRIDVLKMDIEGSELGVISNYQFEIKPTYISIECHEVDNKGCTDQIQNILENQDYDILKGCTDQIQTILENQGYDILSRKFTNIGRTIELQAILPYSRRQT